MKKMTKLMLAFLAVFTVMFTNVSVLTTDGSVYACQVDGNGVPTGEDCMNKGASKGVNEKIYKFGGAVAGVVVGFSLLMIIYGGFKYVTSQGDPRATETAKSQIMFAGIGMLIVMAAFVILKLFTTGSGIA